MRKNRLLTPIIAMTMIITLLVGCGSKENTNQTTDNQANTQTTNDTEKNEKEDSSEFHVDVDTSAKGYITSKDAFVNKMTELLDLSLYAELNESSVGTSETYSYRLNYGNEKEYDLNYHVKLGDGTEFTMPITFSELEKKGWVLQESSQPEMEMGANLMTIGRVENASGQSLGVTAYNPTDKTITFKECTVIRVESQQYDLTDPINPTEKLNSAIDFTICDSLTNASTLEDIISRLGNPSSVFCALNFNEDGTYDDSKITITYTQKSSAYSSIEFKLSGDGNYITEIDYNVAPQ